MRVWFGWCVWIFMCIWHIGVACTCVYSSVCVLNAVKWCISCYTCALLEEYVHVWVVVGVLKMQWNEYGLEIPILDVCVIVCVMFVHKRAFSIRTILWIITCIDIGIDRSYSYGTILSIWVKTVWVHVGGCLCID